MNFFCSCFSLIYSIFIFISPFNTNNNKNININNTQNIMPESESQSEYDCPVVNNKLISKALTYTSFWNLGISNIPISLDIKDDEILVKVKAIAINPIDILLQRLSLFFIGSYRKVYGGDFSGIVIKSGLKSGYKIGDSVYGYRLAPLSIYGTFSQYIVINPKKVIHCDKIPKGMIFEQAASLSCVSATGFGVLKQGLTLNGKSKKITKNDDLENSLKGKKVFIIGSGTSVGSYALQFAKKYMNADKVVVTCASRSFNEIENLGADLIIDYTQGTYKTVNEILEYVKSNGKFDLIIDCVRNESFLDYLDLILKDSQNDGAYCQIYGSKSMKILTCNLFSIILPSFNSIKYKILEFLGLLKHNIFYYKLHYDPTFSSVINKMWKNGTLETPIDSIYRGWTDYEKAIQRVGSAKASGKVVCIL